MCLTFSGLPLTGRRKSGMFDPFPAKQFEGSFFEIYFVRLTGLCGLKSLGRTMSIVRPVVLNPGFSSPNYSKNTIGEFDPGSE